MVPSVVLMEVSVLNYTIRMVYAISNPTNTTNAGRFPQAIIYSKVGKSMSTVLQRLLFFVPMLVGGAQASGESKVGKILPKHLQLFSNDVPVLVGGAQASGSSESGLVLSKCIGASPFIYEIACWWRAGVCGVQIVRSGAKFLEFLSVICRYLSGELSRSWR